MRPSRQLALHSSHLGLQSFLCLFLRYCADAKTDANTEISLIDESAAVYEDRDPWCTRRRDEPLL